MMLSRLCNATRMSGLLMLFLGLQLTAHAHHDRAPDSGPDGLLQHMEDGTYMLLELVMPHRRADENQVLLNVFEAGGGASVKPDTLSARFRPAESDEPTQTLNLERNGPTYGADVNLPEPGNWVLHVEAVNDAGESDTFVIQMELY